MERRSVPECLQESLSTPASPHQTCEANRGRARDGRPTSDRDSMSQRSSRLTVSFSALPAFVLLASFVVTGSNLDRHSPETGQVSPRSKGTRRAEIPIVVNPTRCRSPFAQRFGWPNLNRPANMKAIPDWGSISAALLTGRRDGIRRERP